MLFSSHIGPLEHHKICNSLGILSGVLIMRAAYETFWLNAKTRILVGLLVLHGFVFSCRAWAVFTSFDSEFKLKPSFSLAPQVLKKKMHDGGVYMPGSSM